MLLIKAFDRLTAARSPWAAVCSLLPARVTRSRALPRARMLTTLAGTDLSHLAWIPGVENPRHGVSTGD